MADIPAGNPRGSTPWWFTLIILAVSLPMFSFLYFVGATPDGSEARTLAWLYPAYIVIGAVCSWICYPDRRALAWILVILMALSDAGMWAMTEIAQP